LHFEYQDSFSDHYNHNIDDDSNDDDDNKDNYNGSDDDNDDSNIIPWLLTTTKHLYPSTHPSKERTCYRYSWPCYGIDQHDH